MKKFLIITFIFFFSNTFAQTCELTLDDILEIDSQENFERVLIENNFQRVSNNSIEEKVTDEFKDAFLLLRYAYGYKKNHDIEDTALIWVDGMFGKDKEMLPSPVLLMQFRGAYPEESNSFYNKIFREVKQKCTFDKVESAEDGISTSYYKCPNDNNNGRIGFYIKEDTGVIELPNH